MSEKIRLSVIVLLYKGDHWIKTCVHSLENQSLDRDLYEIILADNGGSTTSVNRYRGHYRVSIVNFPVNCGFAGGYNKTLPYARGEIIVLMNQDVLTHYNCLEELLRVFDSRPEAGAVSASMLMVSENDAIDPHDYVGNTVGYYKLSHFGYASYVLTGTEKDIIPVEFVSGNALGFRRLILKDMGNRLFDSNLVSYAEDLDFSIRFKKTKWEMYVCPKAVIYHFRDDAFSGKPLHKIKKFIHISSNRLIVYYNNLGPFGFLKRLPSLLIGIPLKVSRLDEEAHFNFQRFIIALLFLPFIFVCFVKRLLNKSK